jgi:hypothetical protein
MSFFYFRLLTHTCVHVRVIESRSKTWGRIAVYMSGWIRTLKRAIIGRTDDININDENSRVPKGIKYDVVLCLELAHVLGPVEASKGL